MNFIPRKQTEIENLSPNSLYFELYSNEEQYLFQKFSTLFSDWNKMLKSFPEVSNIGTSFDGFYPGYLKQETKILFIGRENRELEDNNYIEVLYKAIKENTIGEQTLNQSLFHRRMIYLTYALKYGERNIYNIDYADEISPIFGDELSYAFMNLSKFSNDSDNSQSADWGQISKFVDLSSAPRNFIAEEIELIDPDIIFTMNISPFFSKIGNIIPMLGDYSLAFSAGKPYKMIINQKSVLVIDTHHFSVPGEDKIFFDGVIKTIDAVKNNFDLKCLKDN